MAKQSFSVVGRRVQRVEGYEKATGESRYTNGRTYSNIFVCRFDRDGRCTEFREWFMEKPKAG